MALWVPHPSKIVVQHDHGAAGQNMGDVTDVDSKARFCLRDAEKCYTLIFIRGTFVDGSSSADCTIQVDSRLALPEVTAYSSGSAGSTLTTPFDHTLKTLSGVGTGGTPIMLRPEPDEYGIWTFWRNNATGVWDVIVPTWANPNTQRWTLEVGLWDSSRIMAA